MERRQPKRYQLDSSLSIASIATFQITDISRGGSALDVLPRLFILNVWKSDIISSAVFLDGFPSIRVCLSVADNGNYINLTTVVRAKFGKLTSKKESLLLRFLDD